MFLIPYSPERSKFKSTSAKRRTSSRGAAVALRLRSSKTVNFVGVFLVLRTWSIKDHIQLTTPPDQSSAARSVSFAIASFSTGMRCLRWWPAWSFSMLKLVFTSLSFQSNSKTLTVLVKKLQSRRSILPSKINCGLSINKIYCKLGRNALKI